MYVRRHIVRNNFHDPAVRDKGDRERHYYCATAGGPADSPDRFTNASARANRGKACKDARIHTHTHENENTFGILWRENKCHARSNGLLLLFFFFSRNTIRHQSQMDSRDILRIVFSFLTRFVHSPHDRRIVTFTARLTLPCGRESIRRRRRRRRNLQRKILRRVPEKITNSFRSRRFKTTRPINDRSWK